MNDSPRARIERLLLELEEGLDGFGGQSAGVIDEVRADLEAHVRRSQAEGHSEEEAVRRACDEIGNPYELAHHIRKEVPPFGGRGVTVARYVAASAIALWTLFLLWATRPGVYGFDPALLALFALLHFPVILLLWPRIVWRKNWLFGMTPAALGLLVVLAAVFGGRTSTESSALPLDGGAAAAELDAGEPPRTTANLMAVGLGVIALGLLMSMQRRSQRRTAALALLLSVGAVEAAFQWEEMMFRRDRERIRDFMDTAFLEEGVYPTAVNLEAAGLGLSTVHVNLLGGGESYYAFWQRPLSPGHSIYFSPDGDDVHVQD